MNQDVGLQAPKKQQTARSGKVKFLDEDEVIKLASGSFSITRKAYVHGKLQSNEAQKNQKTDQHASHPSSKGEIFFFIIAIPILLCPSNKTRVPQNCLIGG